MKRHAYLIMAHDQPELLKKLICALDDERNDLYIHVDRKAADMEKELFADCVCHAGIYWTVRRNIVWAGESQIRCELDLFRKALEKNHVYYHLISGADFPICSQDEVHSFFEKREGFEFIEFWNRPEKDYLYRIRYVYPLQEKIGRYTNDPETIWLRARSKAFVLEQKLKGIDRVRDYGKPVKCGANWVSVTENFAKFLLEKEKEIEQFFFQGVAADELYKQTLCWNSSFRDKIWSGGHMRLIDWKRGRPYIWQEDDLEEIINTDALFVRKVSEENRLPDLLLDHIKGKREDVL